MDDVRVPAVRILAVVLWLAGFALVTVEALGFSEMAAEYGLLIAGVGAMVSMRCLLREAHHRERAAFDLGRECGDLDLRDYEQPAKVRQLRP